MALDSPGNPILASHRLAVALICPQIAPNTGNIARLCVAAGTALHLVRPLGFVLSDKQLRRSAMDYWPRLRLTVHDDLAAFLQAMNQSRLWFFSSKAGRTLWQAQMHDGDCLVFGSETAGLNPRLWEHAPDQAVRIPQASGERCLNLSTAAGIGLYEALRQIGFRGGNSPPLQ